MQSEICIIYISIYINCNYVNKHYKKLCECTKI